MWQASIGHQAGLCGRDSHRRRSSAGASTPAVHSAAHVRRVDALTGKTCTAGTGCPRSHLSAFVLEGQLHARAVRQHFAVLDVHVHLYNLGNAQITQGFSGGFHRILCRILSGLRARANYLHYLIDCVRRSGLSDHEPSSCHLCAPSHRGSQDNYAQVIGLGSSRCEPAMQFETIHL